MNTDEAIATIQTINAVTGYAFWPTEVSAEAPTKLQGVQVTIFDGSVTCCINADGRCLERIQDAIREKIPDVVFASVDMKPKRKSKDKADVNDPAT
jgi:hypothetical protein